MHGQVVIDTVEGVARYGGRRVPVAAADGVVAGALRVGGPQGPLLRPVTFGTRAWVVRRAGGAAEPVRALAAALLDAATIQHGTAAAETAALEALAMVLAGAHEDAPAFDAVVLTLAAHARWSFDQIEAVEAARADQLARRLQPSPADDGWTHIVMEPAVDDTWESLSRALARRLLDRADVPVPAETATEQRAGTSLPPPDAAASTRASGAPPSAKTNPGAEPAREVRAGDDEKLFLKPPSPPHAAPVPAMAPTPARVARHRVHDARPVPLPSLEPNTSADTPSASTPTTERAGEVGAGPQDEARASRPDVARMREDAREVAPLPPSIDRPSAGLAQYGTAERTPHVNTPEVPPAPAPAGDGWSTASPRGRPSPATWAHEHSATDAPMSTSGATAPAHHPFAPLPVFGSARGQERRPVMPDEPSNRCDARAWADLLGALLDEEADMRGLDI